MIVEKRSLISALLIIITSLIGVVLNSVPVCRVSVLVILIICILRGRQEQYFLNLYYLFAFVPFSLLIYENISNYTMDLSVSTWILAIVNMSAFLIAVDFTAPYKRLIRCIGAGKDRILIENTLILFLLGFSPTIFQAIFKIAMPLASVLTLFSTAALVCAIKSKNKYLIIFVTAIFMFSWISYVSKSTILTFCVACLICYEKYYILTEKQHRRLIILSSVAVIVMIMAFSFANQSRGSMSGSAAVEYYTKYGGLVWNRSGNLLMPYMYLTTPWANLQYVVETQNTRSYGLWLLKPLIGYFQLDDLFEQYYSMKAYSNFNTFTYIACNFKDFGYWGSCVSSIFLGFFSKKIYSRYCKSKSPLDTACYVLVAQAVLEMFFSNEFYTQSFPFTIVIIIGIYKFIFCKQCDVELEDSVFEEKMYYERK